MNLKLNDKQLTVLPQLLSNQYDEILLDGGSRSGKTFLICLLINILNRMWTEGLRGLVCRSKAYRFKSNGFRANFYTYP